ncbi:MAG: ABC transporter ATP-binding protein [Gammaproteobacteria bacterium]|nr:MAG: ABC transporter ATP-binding protein [Gammaproteobacteria bacterium]
MIKLHQIRIAYGNRCVVRALDLHIARGEVFALLGSNGAGKSSTVKAILNFIDIAAGHIRIDGVPHTQARARQPLVFIPEKFVPPYYSTGQQFIDFTLRMHGLRVAEPAVQAYCALLDFNADSLKQPIKSYSKGMCQKLGLIAALATDKPLYLFDEPMSGLDPAARARLRDVFARLKAEGKTLFFCTHMLADVEAVCDRVGILHGGELVFVGSPAACCEHFNADSLDQAFLAATDAKR